MMCVIFVHLIDEDKDAKQETIIENKNKNKTSFFFFIRQTFSQTCRFIVLILLFLFYNKYICSDDQLCCFSFEENSNAEKKHVLREWEKQR